MQYYRDVEEGTIHKVSEYQADDFMEMYPHPENLILMNKYYTDGGGWNGRYSIIAYTLKDDIIRVQKLDDKLTNNEAEYQAVYECLEIIENDSVILSDSLLVVNQIQGLWKINEDRLFTWRNRCVALMYQKTCIIEWIPRGLNLAGKEIEKEKRLRG